MKNFLKTILPIIIVIILVLLVLFFYKNSKNDSDNFINKPIENTVATTTLNSGDSSTTYLYKNHGFSIELPKGYVVPTESVNGRGTYTEIYFPNSTMTYITDVVNQDNNLSKFENKGEEKIGDTTFKIYFNKSMNAYLYWFKQGKVGYLFSGDKDLLKTFKFIGWQ
ncbi:MAG: hypothetical protein WCO35_00170 [Candidatus Nomurabacteria bacterium]